MIMENPDIKEEILENVEPSLLNIYKNEDSDDWRAYENDLIQIDAYIKKKQKTEINPPAKDLVTDQRGIYKQSEDKLTLQPVDKKNQIFASQRGGLFDESFKEMTEHLRNISLNIKDISKTSSNKGDSAQVSMPRPSLTSPPSNIDLNAHEKGVRSPMFDIIFNYRKGAYDRYLDIA